MELVDWLRVEDLSLNEAAYFLTGNDPSPLRQGQKLLNSPSGHWLGLLTRSVKSRVLPALKVTVKGFGAQDEVMEIPPDTVGPHDVLHPALTRISVDAFTSWCLTAEAPVPWPFAQARQKVPDSTIYPAELSAAIDAYLAVSKDPVLMRGRSVKAALTHWLQLNRPELSSNARERVATVANWQPTGGAPKTPGVG